MFSCKFIFFVASQRLKRAKNTTQGISGLHRCYSLFQALSWLVGTREKVGKAKKDEQRNKMSPPGFIFVLFFHAFSLHLPGTGYRIYKSLASPNAVSIRLVTAPPSLSVVWETFLSCLPRYTNSQGIHHENTLLSYPKLLHTKLPRMSPICCDHEV